MTDIYYGVVEDRNDTDKLGRVRVRVVGIHTQNKQDIPTDDLPWSLVMTPTTSPSASGVGATPYLVEGSWVVLIFLDENFQESLVIGTLPGRALEQRSGSVGFSSPTGAFPRYKDAPDLSMVSQPGEVLNHPTMLSREETRATDIVRAQAQKLSAVSADKTAEGFYERTVYSEPSVNATRAHDQYPLTYVEEFEGGHVVEYGNTPGEERYSYTHPAGLYHEFDGAGGFTQKIVGPHVEVTLNDRDIFVRGDCNITVYGSMRHYVKGDYILEVEGNYHQMIHGSRQSKISSNDEYEIGQDSVQVIAGKSSQVVTLDHSITAAGNCKLTVGKDHTITVAGNASRNLTGNLNDIIKGNRSELTIGNVVNFGKAGLKIESANNVVIKATGKVDVDATGNIEITSVANVDVDGAEVYLN